jgi:hypothetical protein
VNDAPASRHGQDLVAEPDVVPRRWQLRPIRPDRATAPQRLIKWRLSIAAVLTEQRDDQVAVARLPRAPEALKPEVEPIAMALRSQSARTVAPLLLDQPEAATIAGTPDPVATHSDRSAQRCHRSAENRHRPPSRLGAHGTTSGREVALDARLSRLKKAGAACSLSIAANVTTVHRQHRRPSSTWRFRGSSASSVWRRTCETPPRCAERTRETETMWAAAC